jgi:hypothetical protein
MQQRSKKMKQAMWLVTGRAGKRKREHFSIQKGTACAPHSG